MLIFNLKIMGSSQSTSQLLLPSHSGSDSDFLTLTHALLHKSFNKMQLTSLVAAGHPTMVHTKVLVSSFAPVQERTHTHTPHSIPFLELGLWFKWSRSQNRSPLFLPRQGILQRVTLTLLKARTQPSSWSSDSYYLLS